MGYTYGFRSNNLSTNNIFGFRQIFKYMEKNGCSFSATFRLQESLRFSYARCTA